MLVKQNKISSCITCAIIGSIYDLLLTYFPKTVRIETTNACNARCVICPHYKMTRPIKKMDEDLFYSIIDECALSSCRNIHLHNFGEPFLDKRLEKFVRYAKKKGIQKIKIFSNGSIISTDRAKKILEAGIDEIKISFDGASKEEFEQIRVPLIFDEVVKNLTNLVKIRNELGSRTKIYVACCSTSDKTKTMEMLESIVDGFSFGKVHNWGGASYNVPKSKIRKPCSRIWQTFTILANGDVSLCCLDYDGSIILGNVTDNSITDIWRSEKYKQIRKKHKQGKQNEIPICASCSKAFL